MLKKTITSSVVFLSIFLYTAFLSLTAFAAESVSVEVRSASCEKNRIVSVDVTANGNAILSAATFEFSFDESVIKFKDVVTDSETLTEENVNGGKVKLSYLCADGKNLKSGAVLFTLRFTSVKEGASDIHVTVKDCVNNNADFIGIGHCKSGRVEVKGKDSKSSAGGTNKQSSAGSKSSSSGSKTKTSKSPEQTDNSKTQSSDKNQGGTEDSSNVDFGNINNISPKTFDSVIPWVIIGFCTMTVLVLVFFCRQKICRTRKNQ